jgi:hypothetical protein
MNRSPVLKFPAPEVRSFSVDPKTKELVIRLHLGEFIPHQVADVLNGLELLVGTLRRTQEFSERQDRTDAAIERQKTRHLDVARTYQRLRLSGLKHRQAINSIFIDPAFSDLNASTADISYWVKVYALKVSR